MIYCSFIRNAAEEGGRENWQSILITATSLSGDVLTAIIRHSRNIAQKWSSLTSAVNERIISKYNTVRKAFIQSLQINSTVTTTTTTMKKFQQPLRSHFEVFFCCYYSHSYSFLAQFISVDD